MADLPDDTTPIPCSACRGTGKVTSNLGGSPHEIPCPWCEGAGLRVADHDAQAAGKGEAGDGDPPDEAA